MQGRPHTHHVNVVVLVAGALRVSRTFSTHDKQWVDAYRCFAASRALP
jgi:hypothetical protein